MDVRSLLYPPRTLARPAAWSVWLGRVVSVLLVIGLGVLLGAQYVTPDKRVLAVLAAVIVIGVAWRLDMISGIGVLVVALPFPRPTSFGNTNFALLLLLLIIYMLRISQRELPTPRRSVLDQPVLALLVAYIVSFYNVEDVASLGLALTNFVLFVATLVLFLMVTRNVRTERDLERMHGFHVIAATLILLAAVYEVRHPGGVLIPGWITLGASEGQDALMKNVRVGSVFFDYELLADFCGLNLLLFTFLFVRARDVFRRTLMGGLIGLTLFVLFCTVTRGPIVSLAISGLYLLWMTRRRLNVVPFAIGAAAIVVGFGTMNFLVSTFTGAGDLFSRLSHTEFVGFVPETRADTWSGAWDRMMQHPLIGSGPYYSIAHGLTLYYWPHNLYLYLGNIVGVVGLACFLWLLWTLWKATRPDVDVLDAPGYARSYLLVARAQLVFFLVDQFKIEYLRNPTYQFQVWLMFALWVSASRIREDQRVSAGEAVRPAAPAQALRRRTA